MPLPCWATVSVLMLWHFDSKLKLSKCYGLKYPSCLFSQAEISCLTVQTDNKSSQRPRFQDGKILGSKMARSASAILSTMASALVFNSYRLKFTIHLSLQRFMHANGFEVKEDHFIRCCCESLRSQKALTNLQSSFGEE